MKIGITCYPTVGGSGVLATSLGEALAARGHEVHFISYERPFRLPGNQPRLHFHPVAINEYDLFRYPDYTLPLSVRMAEVSRTVGLDILHVHYAVPHATAALLARDMLPPHLRPRIVTTLHGTDTTVLGSDPGYRPAIHHALCGSDAVTCVSAFLRRETQQVLGYSGRMDVIHNFYVPRLPQRSRAEVRDELGMGDKILLLHSSNLRPIKRIDLLLEAVARIQPRDSFKLLILAGGSFAPYAADLSRLGLEGRVIVREKVTTVEDYLQAADLGVYSSDMESFCLSILEAMFFGCCSVATAVGGIPEVISHESSGILTQPGDVAALTRALETLIADPERRAQFGAAAQQRARQLFTADAMVPQYEAVYRRAMQRKHITI